MSEPRNSEPRDATVGRSLRRGIATAGIQTVLVAIALVVTGLTPWNLTDSPDGGLLVVLGGVGGLYLALSAGFLAQAEESARARAIASQLGFGGAIVGLIYTLAQLELTVSSETVVKVVVGVLSVGILLPLAAAAPRWLRHRPGLS